LDIWLMPGFLWLDPQGCIIFFAQSNLAAGKCRQV
jgi:hypothetical protein